MVVEAQTAGGPPDVLDEPRLDDGNRAELGEPPPLIGAGDARMLDAEAVIDVRMSPRDSGAGVDHRLHAPIAHGVDRDAKAARGGLVRVLSEIAEEHAHLQRVATDRGVERDGDATVGEQLHRPDPEMFVALAGRRSVESSAGVVHQERRRVRKPEHPDGKRSGPRHHAIGGLRLR